jgi:hypothetical protein
MIDGGYFHLRFLLVEGVIPHWCALCPGYAFG